MKHALGRLDLVYFSSESKKRTELSNQDKVSYENKLKFASNWHIKNITVL